MVSAVRGAVSIEENTPRQITQAVGELISKITGQNGINEEDFIHIIFSVTEDVSALNPATALRKFGYSSVPLFCVQEAKCDGMLTGIIRVLITFNNPEKISPQPVYLGKTKNLRPDVDAGN